MNCPNPKCNQPIGDDDEFCNNCGNSTPGKRALYNRGLKMLETARYSPRNHSAFKDKFAEHVRKIIETFQKVLEIDPKFTPAIVGKGMALLEIKKYQEAIDIFNKALEIDPQNTDAMNGKEWALEKLG